MPIPIILILSHGNISTNKLLLRNLELKGLNCENCVLGSLREFDTNNYKLQLMNTYKKDLSDEQKKLRDSLYDLPENIQLANLAQHFFDVVMQIDYQHADYTQFYLFVESNLGSPAYPSITNEFHLIVNKLEQMYRSLFAGSYTNYYVYSFSDTTKSTEAARRYLARNTIDGMKLRAKVLHHIVARKQEISQHISLSPGFYFSSKCIRYLSCHIFFKEDKKVLPVASSDSYSDRDTYLDSIVQLESKKRN